jgi:outer membrane protein OmpA-like peptidoglycan-associated protein
MTFQKVEWCRGTLVLSWQSSRFSLTGEIISKTSDGTPCPRAVVELTKSTLPFDSVGSVYITLNQLENRLKTGTKTRGQRIILNHILFAQNSDSILNGFTPTIDTLARFLKEYPNVRITINGHTDDDPAYSDLYCLNLSLARARAVKKLLVQQYAIAENRINCQGFGKTRPLYSPGPDAPKNRRTEFEVDE